MKTIEKILALLLLLFSIGFNLWLYRLEPTATIDPNDNAFQYALVDRTNQIWDYANRTCPHNLSFIICHLSLLTDHWVPNWAQGYNLPYYYSHIPQILIVGSYRLFAPLISNFKFQISLFQYYHIIIYLLLCFFPLSAFLAFRILKLPWLTAGIAALFASQISTDGLYGIDQSSFLWRGWGLSSQLFALIWLPLAIASIIRYVSNSNAKWPMLNDKLKGKKIFSIYHLSFIIPPIFFLSATTMGHLGIGMMAFLAIPVICLTPTIMFITEKAKKKQILESLIRGIKQTVFLAIPPVVILSYWIVPAFLNNNFHNISVWDPVWKFNSFGAKDVLVKFFNGELFDFGRFPVFTILVLIGLCTSLQNGFPHIAFLFLSFLILFFGRTTWGGLLDLIPGMSEFHQHRFLVGVHIAGLFLAPIGLAWIVKKVSSIKYKVLSIFLLDYLFIGLFVYWIIVPQTIKYASYNTTLIQQANDEYTNAKPDFDLLLTTIKELEKTNPGRVYALRGGEGKTFQISSTPYYMQLSTYGIPTTLWLPETWSMNSDTEQFFVESDPSHYSLYNIRYVVANPEKKPQPFWKLLKETEHWKLYTVNTDGYITIGTAPSVVFSKKTDIINLIHLWLQSSYPKQGIFPELSTHNTSLPHFTMLDSVTYQTPDSKEHNLFAEVPIYENVSSIKYQVSSMIKIKNQVNDADMRFSATVEITAPCPTCVVVLKQTYHPNWRAKVNGKAIKPIIVFPFFTAIRLEQPETYEVVFLYTPKFKALDIK